MAGRPEPGGRTGGDHAAVSVFRRHPKIDDAALIRLAYAFGQGIGIEAAAKANGLSRKTVRSLYLDLRSRLAKPAFRRWHSLRRALVRRVNSDVDLLMRAAFIDVLADCHANGTCYRVFRRGNRKDRLCRACPIPSCFPTAGAAAEAVAMVDTVRSFYGRLGIREPGSETPVVFRLRLIHSSVIASVRESTRRLPNGLLDPSDQDYLALGQLLLLLMDDLAADQATA